jgi:pilus assembly protein Flp/PilA
MKRLMNFFKDEEGVTAIEYGLIAALIALVILIAVVLVGQGLSSTFQNIGTHVQSVAS